ncbi:hypothetical protein [uncultured Lamprocystis sp.]|uniref:hypothetical protein n=1 Tax=uncultured Lamprocystis sp. TaxID=543132 RepID=UPI0025FF858D|nr:hypothetical protein [uncultured Lamprocystis sp.]
MLYAAFLEVKLAAVDYKYKTRELALFDLALDSKLRGCDLVALHVSDVANRTSRPLPATGRSVTACVSESVVTASCKQFQNGPGCG